MVSRRLARQCQWRTNLARIRLASRRLSLLTVRQFWQRLWCWWKLKIWNFYSDVPPPTTTSRPTTASDGGSTGFLYGIPWVWIQNDGLRKKSKHAQLKINPSSAKLNSPEAQVFAAQWTALANHMAYLKCEFSMISLNMLSIKSTPTQGSSLCGSMDCTCQSNITTLSLNLKSKYAQHKINKTYLIKGSTLGNSMDCTCQPNMTGMSEALNNVQMPSGRAIRYVKR